MSKEKRKIEKYSRKAVFAELKQFDVFADAHDFIEVTEWKNGEGFDVDICGKLPTRFQLTYGEYDALKKLVKTLTNEDIEA